MTLNPVTIKELRQLMRSPFIWFVLMGYPVALFIIFGFAVNVGMHDVNVNDILVGKGLGRNPFIITNLVTGATVGIVLPLVATIRTMLECAKDRLRMEFTTALTPWQLVNGKFMAMAILSTTLVAVSMPFFALTYMIRGVQLTSVFVLPMMLLLFSLVQTAIGLSIATLNILNVPLRILGLLGVFAIGSRQFLFSLEDLALPSFEYTPTGITVVLLIAISAWGFFIRMAAAHISPPFVDSERPLRQTTLILLILTLPIVFLNEWKVWTFGWGIICWLLLGRSCLLFRPMPRTLRCRAPQSFLGRLASFPFTTGAYTGPIFVAAMFALTMLPGYFMLPNRDWTNFIIFSAEIFAMFFIGIGSLPWFRSPRAPLTILIIVCVFIFLTNPPCILVFLRGFSIGSPNLLLIALGNINDHPFAYLFLTGMVWVPAIIYLLPGLIHEFQNYRRP